MKPTEQAKFDVSLYNDEFFAWHLTHVHESSVRCMEWYCDNYHPKSVLDIGCGIGSYLLGAFNKGAMVIGLEISKASVKFTPKQLSGFIFYSDALKRSLPPDIKHDCVICLEVAEHIEPENSEQLIATICNNSNGRILFSAAPVGQEGCGHINCQPKEYWIDLFAKFDRHPLEFTTDHVIRNWKALGAPDYIVKNLMVL